VIYYLLIAGTLAFFLWRSFKVRTSLSAAHEGEPNSLNTVELYTTLLATAVGGGLIFGLIQFGQIAGTIGLLLGLVYGVSFIALGYLAPSIRRACASLVKSDGLGEDEPVSVVTLLARRYNRGTWGLILLAYQVVYIGFLAAQYVAIGRLAHALGIPLSAPVLIIISASVVMIYVGFGGFKSVVATDIAQFGIIALIFALSVGAIVLEGTLDFQQLPQGYWDPFANAELTSMFVWLAVFLLPTLLLRLDHWQRIVAASDEHTARRAYVLAGLTLPAIFAAFLVVGASATAAGSSSPFYIFTHHFRGAGSIGGEVLFACIVVALLCAVISSADTVLNAGAAALTQSLRAWGLVSGGGVWTIVFSSGVITVLAVVAAILIPDVVRLITEGFKVMITLLPAIAAALLKRSPSDLAGTLSVAGGLIGWGFVYFATTAAMWGYIVGFAAAALILLLVYRIED